MKNVSFSSIKHEDMERVMAAKTAQDFMLAFEIMLQSLYCDDVLSHVLRHPIVENLSFLFGMTEETPFPTKGENLRFFPSVDIYNKIENSFRIVDKYQAVLKKQHTPCGRAAVRRKIRKVDFEMSAQELYSAVIYLFLHKGLGKIEDFKTLLLTDN